MSTPSAAPGVVAPAAALATCPTCRSAVDGRFCGRCGERMLTERDRSLAAFLGEAFATLTTLDNRFWRTLRGIPRPGFLTREYLAGRRGRYLGPLHLFLVFSVVFFLVSPWLGLSTTRLEAFADSPVIGAVAAPMVDVELVRRGIEVETFATDFARVKNTQERFMVLIAIPLFAVVLKLLYWRRSYVEHLAFATYTLGSLLLLLVAYLFVFTFGVFAVRSWLGLPPAWRLSGLHVPLLFGMPILGFAFVALRRVYGGALPVVAAKALLASVGLWASMMLYEYMLFFTTMLALRFGA